MTDRTVTPQQFAVLDAVRAQATPLPDGRVLIDALILSDHSIKPRRVFASLKAHGLLNVGRWHVWLTDAGRAFLNDGNKEGM